MIGGHGFAEPYFVGDVHHELRTALSDGPEELREQRLPADDDAKRRRWNSKHSELAAWRHIVPLRHDPGRPLEHVFQGQIFTERHQSDLVIHAFDSPLRRKEERAVESLTPSRRGPRELVGSRNAEHQVGLDGLRGAHGREKPAPPLLPEGPGIAASGHTTTVTPPSAASRLSSMYRSSACGAARRSPIRPSGTFRCTTPTVTSASPGSPAERESSQQRRHRDEHGDQAR